MSDKRKERVKFLENYDIAMEKLSKKKWELDDGTELKLPDGFKMYYFDKSAAEMMKIDDQDACDDFIEDLEGDGEIYLATNKLEAKLQKGYIPKDYLQDTAMVG